MRRFERLRTMRTPCLRTHLGAAAVLIALAFVFQGRPKCPADYIASVRLAQIRLDTDTGTAPTILRVFRDTEVQVQGLSPWDRAFLYSLYTTSQSSVLEVTTIKRRMFEQIIAH
jgi:hypothetical protein